MDRRAFLLTLGAAAAAGCGASTRTNLVEAAPEPGRLPRWRGFNLLEKFVAERQRPFRASDFDLIAGWGFDFVRLPLSYHCWSRPQDPYRLDEAVLKEIDQAVAYGRERGIHVNINLHRAPGYCVNPPAEPLDLWSDPRALDAFAFQWAHFAERYKGIPSAQVSFDLLNEPPDIAESVYAGVMRGAVKAIRNVDPGRLIIVDGLRWGRGPVLSLADLGIGQSTRGYDPMTVSHYQATWVGRETWPEPAWPLTADGETWDRSRLAHEVYEPWVRAQAQGIGVHVGEWGAYNQTPHAVALAWMKDLLEIWKAQGWGWALWNLRGSFGVLESGRADAPYEMLQGMKLDRRMLELLRAY